MTASVAILDYGSGNLRSAQRALERTGADVTVTSDLQEALNADGLVVPGVGAYEACMKGLREVRGERIIGRRLAGGRPVLGICVGMQILFEESSEFGPVRGLGVLPGRVVRFRANGVKIPHMGWNALRIRSRVPALDGVADGTYVYFVHSYYAEPADPALIAATSDYGGCEFTAAVARDNLFATQFHPEKSQAAGLGILQNFVRAAAPSPRVAVSA